MLPSVIHFLHIWVYRAVRWAHFHFAQLQECSIALLLKVSYRPAVSEAPESLIEMQNLRPCPRPAEAESAFCQEILQKCCSMTLVCLLALSYYKSRLIVSGEFPSTSSGVACWEAIGLRVRSLGFWPLYWLDTLTYPW